eukprot:CAMPEP_0174294544 /NCGR_PEP_ID=MMETSP0809-20121228/41953_1 /TAXON_ID=73025 ORGANISM="Eutreptiella gymnastica-like, Strain CCMP1594" /NCGR_SAMPLE_ID=MMETSP0809 /ASSEMBLY_ACC=CAM_ASM_000658 /LENGTH=65 /DNA_ID=CAMNT_0015396081 /DNA_START=93 /DNA_END=287 /DNA_ORIENTATION=-
MPGRGLAVSSVEVLGQAFFGDSFLGAGAGARGLEQEWIGWVWALLVASTGPVQQRDLQMRLAHLN